MHRTRKIKQQERRLKKQEKRDKRRLRRTGKGDEKGGDIENEEATEEKPESQGLQTNHDDLGPGESSEGHRHFIRRTFTACGAAGFVETTLNERRKK